MPEPATEPKFDEWCVLELFGHRKLAGRVSEATIAGGAFLRLDIPDDGSDQAYATQFYTPSAVYCMTPVTEELARRTAKEFRPAPVTKWDFPALSGRLPEPGPQDDVIEEDSF